MPEKGIVSASPDSEVNPCSGERKVCDVRAASQDWQILPFSRSPSLRGSRTTPFD